MEQTTDLVDRIRESGLKPTAQRVDILKYLHSNQNFQSVEEIYENLYKNFKVFSKATIYTTLDAFEEAGLVKKFFGRNGETRVDVDMGDCAYFLCSSCGRIYRMNVYRIETDLERNGEGFEVDRSNLTYDGLCSGCKGQAHN